MSTTTTTTTDIVVPTTTTVTLPEIRDGMADAIIAWEVSVNSLESALANLEALLPALDERIERNRQRSERARHSHCNGNGHRSDYAIKLARNGGVMLVCRKCGTAIR